MRVVFMGTPDFAVPTLDALVEAGHEVVLVVAQPDRRAGRGKKLRKPPVAQRALELGLPLSQPRAIRSGSFPARVGSLDADVGVVIAYGRILTPFLLNAPTHGCINLHASLLPRWRGAAPIQAAILHGDAVTGVCAQQMEEGLDTGPVYRRAEVPLGPDTTAGALHDTLAALSAEVAVATLADLAAGATPTPQPDEGITWAPKISKEDGRLDWSEPAVALDRRVRAMSPWPGGWCDTERGRLKVKAVHPGDGPVPAGASPGTVLDTAPLTVATGDGALVLDRVQAPGRRPVDGSDYANGAHLQPGAPL